jgi:hypothetical protein
MTAVIEMDSEALKIYEEKGAAAAVDHVTSFSVSLGNSLVKDWGDFFGQLFVKYRDGYVLKASPGNTECGCTAANADYPQQWYDRIAAETKTHYLYSGDDQPEHATADKKKTDLLPVSKKILLSKM